MNNNDVPEIDPDEIQFEKKIGEGSYGYVFSGKCRGKGVAIKVFKRKDDFEETELEKFREEVKIMSKIYHPNVVLFMGACTRKGKDLMLVTEIMKTDLETLLIKEKRNISLFQKIQMAKDAALGMNWLHRSNPIFIHRDLKLSNLLVDESNSVHVCDFGLAQMKPRGVSNLEYDPHGSPIYMAPEVFVGEYNEKCDIYSYGICMWELLTQSQAFSEMADDLPTFIHAVCDLGSRPAIPSDCPKRLSKLISSCWIAKPALRPTFEQILLVLDKVLIDVAIPDDTGRNIWKKKFFGKLEAPWEDFLQVLYKALHIPEEPDLKDVKIRCLEALLCNSAYQPNKGLATNKTINMENFGKILSFFGPLKIERTKKPDLYMLTKIKTLLQQKWFHGDISGIDAETKLNDQKPGCYLVRFSTRVPGCFTISYKSKNKELLHHRVKYTPGEGYFFGTKYYDDFEKLIKFESKNKTYFWKEPCPGSQFAQLFLPEKSEPRSGTVTYNYEGYQSLNSNLASAPIGGSMPNLHSKKKEKKSMF